MLLVISHNEFPDIPCMSKHPLAPFGYLLTYSIDFGEISATKIASDREIMAQEKCFFAARRSVSRYYHRRGPTSIVES